MRILGADPGSASGGLAIYDGGKLFGVWPMPIMKSKGRGNELNIVALNDILEFEVGGWDHAFIEQVQARPMEGRGSGFKFGVGCGIIQGLIIGRRLPHTMIPPSVWKPKLGLNNDKEFSRTRAIQIFPEMSSAFALKKSHNVAEAALISYYGWSKLEGKLV